ncbi:hypothetical protein BJ508DRAFT_110148 [Ascobolus immersus RN42]|uniref:Secreted protein n=1 Tax=Ascobolus immersus RN42 TaxID=1160509 RepID=A0A3N4I6N4_ASCIM|nr:hypothetical protein BJ508DRAFT_110148 [Ascobolus immersus RN42]
MLPWSMLALFLRGTSMISSWPVHFESNTVGHCSVGIPIEAFCPTSRANGAIPIQIHYTADAQQLLDKVPDWLLPFMVLVKKTAAFKNN